MPTSSPVCPASAWAVSSMKWRSNPAAPTVRTIWTTSWPPVSWPEWKASPWPSGPTWGPRVRAARPAARTPAATASLPRPCTAASSRARDCTPSTAWWTPTTSLETGFSLGSYTLANLRGDITFRRGLPGETYEGIGKGGLNLENLPLLADALGPFGSPVSDSTRALVDERTRVCLTIIYGFDGAAPVEEALRISAAAFARFCRCRPLCDPWCVQG